MSRYSNVRCDACKCDISIIEKRGIDLASQLAFREFDPPYAIHNYDLCHTCAEVLVHMINGSKCNVSRET
jgi:hypothetical protein